MGLTLNIDFDFFQRSLEKFCRYDKHQNMLEEIFDSSISGGPMRDWVDEFGLWKMILGDTYKYDVFFAFVNYYVTEDIMSYFTYESFLNPQNEEVAYYSEKFYFPKEVHNRETQVYYMWEFFSKP